MHILTADYANPTHAEAILTLLNAYACDPMGGATPLSATVRQTLIPALAAHPGAFSLLAYEATTPIALANCFEGFSTFAARPLINIHDVYVTPAARGQGIIQPLLAALEHEAKARGCCKITLEVLTTNHRAQAAYARAGYGDYALDPTTGTALFWQKKLP